MKKIEYLFKHRNKKYVRNMQFDDVALYSITPDEIADRMSELIVQYVSKNATITDAMACVGGNTISFSKYFETVNAIELDENRCKMLRHNVNTFKLKNVNVFCGDTLNVIPVLTQDVIFMDPPWGGEDYKTKKEIDILINNIPLATICNNFAKQCKYMALKLPLNFNFKNFLNSVLLKPLKIHEMQNSGGHKICSFIILEGFKK